MIMKPYTHIRSDKGYCCEWDDGPFSQWKKKVHRYLKRKDRQKAKLQLKKDLKDE